MPEREPHFEEIPMDNSPSEKQQQWQAVVEGFEKNLIKDFGGLEGFEQEIREPVYALNALGIETSNSCEGHFNHGRIAPWISIEKSGKPSEQYVGQKAFEEQVYEKSGISKDYLQRDREYIREYDGEINKMREVKGYKSGSEFTAEDWKEFTIIDETLREKYGITEKSIKTLTYAWSTMPDQVKKAAEQEVLNEETSDWKAWNEENQKMVDKTRGLLDTFYRGKSVPENTRIVFEEDRSGLWCLHNGGEDYIDVSGGESKMEQQEKKRYQQIINEKNPKEEQEALKGNIELYRKEFKEFAEFLKKKFLE